ncbi:MAG: cob(I)yrinic acid a,c-diamide adenosyltransferase [Candidatus Kapabacteria bacterium]|nr:cob(I)yrinic acid a,c-diamide adenosyltransferase [Candidatus Kapabacteria bacterium]
MKIYTKTGDKGKTALFGGKRVSKASVRVDSYGTIDELNSHIGLVIAHELSEDVRGDLTKLSSLLFNLGADLATPHDPPPKNPAVRMQEEHITWLEQLIDKYYENLPQETFFTLPGGCVAAANLHIARTICRRAERIITELAATEEINNQAVIFVNRLSDYLFCAAKKVNADSGAKELPWNKDL